jgi:acyl-CoA thioesterase-2
MPPVPDAETLPPDEGPPDVEGWPHPQEWPSEWRHALAPWTPLQEGESPSVRVWMRLNGTLADDPALHAAMIVYYSDAGSFGSIERRYGEFDWGHSASLDHAVWFHQPARWDDWILVTTETPVSFAGRALMHRKIYRRDGAHVASVAQEAVFRPLQPPK